MPLPARALAADRGGDARGRGADGGGGARRDRVALDGKLGALGAAGRRFALLLTGVSGFTALLALAWAGLAKESVSRSLALGFYVVGSFLLVGGFFVGNRGPVRLKKGEEDAGMPLLGLPLMGRKGLRWATQEERDESISTSAILVTLGFVLILIGVAADSRVRLL